MNQKEGVVKCDKVTEEGKMEKSTIVEVGMKQIRFEELTEIVRRLRAPDGCSWDRAQTHESLKPCMIEEAYEVTDSIDRQDLPNLEEELGDVLLQVVMHAVIAEENKEFTIEDVISGISEKMVRRHPHVFPAEGEESEEQNGGGWEEIKRREKQEATISEGMNRIPKALPAALRAQKVQKKAVKAGLAPKNIEALNPLIQGQFKNLEEAIKTNDNCKINEAYGKLLFLTTFMAVFLQINAENSLTNATNKFINRFVSVECRSSNQQREFGDITIDEIMDLWNA